MQLRAKYTNPRSSLANRNNDVTGVLDDATFSMEDESFGESKTVDLKPNGRAIGVTNENKKEYVE